MRRSAAVLVVADLCHCARAVTYERELRVDDAVEESALGLGVRGLAARGKDLVLRLPRELRVESASPETHSQDAAAVLIAAGDFRPSHAIGRRIQTGSVPRS